MDEQTRKALELAKAAIFRMDIFGNEDEITAAIDAALSAPAAQMSHLETIATFHTAKAGRTEVAAFFREHLKRHDFSDYIMTTLAADFACALAPTLHALRIDSPAAPVAQPGWCPGCTPDECEGCGVVTPAAINAARAVMDARSTLNAAPVAQPLADELLNAVKSAITCSYESHGRRSVNAQAWDRLMQAVAAVSHGIGQGGAA